MKRALMISLIILSAAGLTACGKKGDVNPPPSQTNSN